MTDDLFDRWLEHHREEDTPSTKTWPARRVADSAEKTEGDAAAEDVPAAEAPSKPIDPLTDDLSKVEAIEPAAEAATPPEATPETAAAPTNPEPTPQPTPAAAAEPIPAAPAPTAAAERASLAGPPEDTTWQAELFDAVNGGEPNRTMTDTAELPPVAEPPPTPAAEAPPESAWQADLFHAVQGAEPPPPPATVEPSSHPSAPPGTVTTTSGRKVELPEPALAAPTQRFRSEFTDAQGPETSGTTNVDFPPKRLWSIAAGFLVIASLIVTGAMVYRAYDDPTTLTVGVAGTMAALTLVLWAIRASALPVRLSIIAGQLIVDRGGSRRVFDLRSPYTPIEVNGKPGDYRWSVRFGQANEEPFEVTSSMVDPKAFMAAVGHFDDFKDVS